MNPTDFLTELWTDKPPGLIATWRLEDKRTRCFRSPQAAGDSLDGKIDHYIAVGACRDQVAATTRPGKPHIVALAGLWLDLDVNGGPDHKTGAAPSLAAAERIAKTIEEPTLTVCSGYGLHAWWLFHEPWVFRTTTERDEAQQLAWQWYATHRTAAKQDGWTIDHTHDLARLLRPPGTLNGKGGHSVLVTVHSNGGPRYRVDWLASLAAPAGPMPTVSLFDQHIQTTELDQAAFDKLLADSREFARTWNHERTDQPAWTDSEHDLALCSIAAKHGWDKDQLAALIVAHRAKLGSPKGQRADYIQRTVGRVLADQDDNPANRKQTEPAPGKGIRTLTAGEWAKHIADMLESPDVDAISTPFEKLTEALDGGFRPGEVVLICGYTSHGKSVLADMIVDTASAAGRRCHLYMTEMTAYRRGLRLLARHTGVAFWKLKRKRLTAEDWQQIYELLGQLNYGCSDVSDATVDQVVDHIRENAWDLAVVDLIHGFHYQDERDLSATATAMSRASKPTSMDHPGTVIVAAAHLNDGQMRDQRSPKRPKPGLHSIKGSSSLKQNADQVWFVWQQDDDQGIPTGEGSVWVAKNRDGDLPGVQVVLNHRRMVFEEQAA